MSRKSILANAKKTALKAFLNKKYKIVYEGLKP